MKNIEEIRERSAAALSRYLDEIMPEEEVSEAFHTLSSWGFNINQYNMEKAIANHFQVSIQIAGLRLFNLGFFMPIA
jgi:Zn-dependent peptidase ImmA (M78 family)